MTPDMAAGVDVSPANGERGLPEDSHRYFLAQRLRPLRSMARSKARCFAVWSVMPVTVILVVGAEAAAVSTRDGRLVPGAEGIAETASHRTAPGRLTRPDGRGETLAALRLRWPVYGPISSDFGAPRASRTGFHSGIDIGASRGTFVRAPAGGTVAFVGWRRGYGRTIVIDHGHQISTLYGHLAKPEVVRGQTVEKGAAIGLIGATGHASGPHLHYEVLVNGRPINPRLTFARPRDIHGRSQVAAREDPSGRRQGSVRLAGLSGGRRGTAVDVARTRAYVRGGSHLWAGRRDDSEADRPHVRRVLSTSPRPAGFMSSRQPGED
jgi:Peptidase family M23